MAGNKHGQRNAVTPKPGSEAQQRVLQVTRGNFLEYLNSVNADATCGFCGGDYGVSSDPSGEGAPLVATPVPHVKGLGLWLYTVSCMKCGHTLFFHAPFVAEHILDK